VTLRSNGHRSTHSSALAGRASALAGQVAALALALALAVACHKDTVVTSRVVTAWAPTACPVDANGFGTYLALGDYDGSQQPPVHHPIAAGTNLTEIDTQARELVINASENGANWEGLAPVPSSGDVNVLVLPYLSPCALSGGVGKRTGSTLAPIGTGRVMIVGGNASPVPPTYVADLTTGAVTEAKPDLTPPRLGATVTPFGDGALVAGGISDSGSGVVMDNAEVYLPSLGGFHGTIALSEQRTNHAAVALADGRTLLLGGSHDAGGSTLLQTLDVIDPTTSSAQEEGFATLVTPRLDPVVVRLSTGEILVAGGKDAVGAPVTSMEWVSFEAGTNELQKPQPWGGAPFTMTALQGGGALVVVASAQSSWIVGEAGDIKQAPATLGMLSNPVLFGGAGGAPVLWTGDHFLRWQPWTATWGEFVTIDGAPPSIQGTIVSPDPGLGIWFDANQRQLVALRFDTHNAYSELGTGGSVDLGNDTSPGELWSPTLVSFSPDTGITVTSAANAFVDDRTYEDVAVHVTSESALGACVVLRTTSGQDVILPDPTSADGGKGPSPGKVLDVQRSGATVSFSVDGRPYQTSATAIAVGTRVAVGVRGFSETSPAVVTGMRITRPGTP
jgi:energy-coupling factor transporter ATP-binding protein EcfA2